MRKNGILIGRVDAIEDLDDGVFVHADIDGDRPLLPQLRAARSHVRAGRRHDRFCHVAHGRAGTQPLADGAIIPRRRRSAIRSIRSPSWATCKTISQRRADRSATPATKSPSLPAVSTQAFGSETEEGRVKRLLDTTEAAMAQFAQTMSSINEISAMNRSLRSQPVCQQSNRRPPANAATASRAEWPAAAVVSRPRMVSRRPTASRCGSDFARA